MKLANMGERLISTQSKSEISWKINSYQGEITWLLSDAP